MALTFLDPITGIVAGALGGIGVAAFYFLKLRRRPVRVSTIAFWEEAASDLQVNAPFKMIRPSILLLLQLLAVALLAAALARPAIDQPTSAETVLVVIDRSASMSAQDAAAPDGNTTAVSRLEHAKARAIEIVERLPAEARVSVLTVAGEARSVVDATSNRRQVREAIRNITPTDQPADFGSAFDVLSAFVSRAADGTEDAPPPLVVLLSDGSFDRKRAGAATLGDADVRYVPPQIAGTNEPDDREEATTNRTGANAGIVAFAARRDFDDPTLVRVFTRVVSNAQRSSTVGLAASVDGETVDSVTVTTAQEGDAGLFAASHTFRLVVPRGGLVEVSIASGGGVLQSDDATRTLLLPPSAPDVLLVRPNGARETPGRGAIVDALESADPGRLEVVTASDAERLGYVADGVRNAGFDLVVYDGVEPDAPPAAPSISFAATVPGTAVEAQRIDASGAQAFAFWDREHPVMRSVSLNDVLVEPTLRLTLPDTASTDVATLASGESDPLIVLSGAGSHPRIIVPFALDDTNWWRLPDFPLFIANAMDTLGLRPGSRTGLSFTTSEPLSVDLGENLAGETVSIDPPNNEPITREVPESGVLTMDPLDHVGIYTLRSAQAAPLDPPLLAVNLLDQNETLAAIADELDIAGRRVERATAAGVAPREIWPWFLIAALAVLAAEWLLFVRRISP